MKNKIVWFSLMSLVVLIAVVFSYGVFFNQDSGTINFPTPERDPQNIYQALAEQKELLESEIDMAIFRLSTKLIPVCQTAINSNLETRDKLSDKIISLSAQLDALQIEVNELKRRVKK